MPGASELRDDNALIRVHWHGVKDFSKRRCLNSTRRTRLVPQGSLALVQITEMAPARLWRAVLACGSIHSV